MQGFLADMQTFTIEEAAALIANKYRWHEGAQRILLKQLLDAEKDGTLIVRHPHTYLPYRPKEYCEYFERVKVSDLNRYFEAAEVPWRLDNGGETADSLFETEWWNLHQVLARVYVSDRALVREGAVVQEGLGFAMRLMEESTNRPRACYLSFRLPQEALFEALQTRKLTAYGLKNGEGDLTEIPALQWTDLTFLWNPDHPGPRDCFLLGATRWIALHFRRKDILALWPVPLDQPDDKAPAEAEPAAPAASYDTATRAATSKHTAKVGEKPGVHVGDNAFRSNAFTSMDGLTWAEITITFIGTESVRIRARGRNETFTFEAMGFKRRTTHMAKPNECWKTFLHLAIVSTFDKTWNDIPRTHDLKKRISRLRDQLKRFFGIADDPIAFKKCAGYQPAFNLMAEEHVIQDTHRRHTDCADEEEEDYTQRLMSEVPGRWSR
jgi:hypothetical protein